jgi:hypothetical protein
MAQEALFLNGVYAAVLEEILAVQEALPDHIMYLQPYSESAIKRLRDDPPSVERPRPLYISPTDDLAHIHYVGEVVGWEDKREISEPRRNVLNRVIWTLQPNETGLYETARGLTCVNLLQVRRVRREKPPFPASELVKLSDDKPLGTRTTAGGYAYVYPRISQT